MSADNERLHFRKPQVIGDIHEQPLPRSENQRVRGSSPSRRTKHPAIASRSSGRQDHGKLFASRVLRPQQLFEDVGGLSISQLAPKVAILSHADLRVAELVTDLPGRHVGIIKKRAACGGAGVGESGCSTRLPARADPARCARPGGRARAAGPAGAVVDG
jgi:hypothetical protein